ncbi:MAG: tRNA-dihydrouridine synthase [Deltaproteobacteria bacterium]|nr:tRNA-dihydrouridine synthase [Deltaproteobacteria bacterium]
MPLAKLQIAAVEINPNLILAPMSGITNCCFRRLIKRVNPNAVGLVVSEFISVEALSRKNMRSVAMMKIHPEERPVAIQVFGHDIARVVDAAVMVEQSGADILDINSGCPVPKVVKKGGGAELMRQPAHLAELLRRVRKAISIPLTLKIRSGWDENNKNALEIGKIAADNGVDMLCVHGRTRSSLYRGEADWGIVDEVGRSVSVPVVCSGDVADGATARRCFDYENISALMIGRAVLANPWVFSEIKVAMNGGDFVAPGEIEIRNLLQEYREMLVQEFSDRAALGYLKQLSVKVTKRVPNLSAVRKNLCAAKTVREFEDSLKRLSS